MADEFTVSVGVEGDFSKLRAQLRAELDAIQKQGVSVPVSTGAPGTSVAAPPGAVAPVTATTHAQAVQQATQTAVAAVASSAQRGTAAAAYTASAVQTAAAAAGVAPYDLADAGPYSLAAGPARNRGSSIMDLSQQATPEDLFPPEAPGEDATAAATGRGGGRGGRGFLGGRGYGRALGAAVIARDLGRLVVAGQQYDERVALSRGSPRALAMADLEYRKEAFNAIPIFGPMGYALNQAVTGDEAYIKGMFQAADDQDAYTDRMRARGDLAQEFRNRGEQAGLRGSNLSRAVVEQQYQSSILEIQRKSAPDEEALHAKFDAQRQAAEIKFKQQLGPQEVQSLTRPAAEKWYNTELNTIQQAENDSVSKLQDQFGPMRSAANAVRQRALEDINTGVSAESMLIRGNTVASLYGAANQPFAAQTTRRFAQFQAAYLKAAPENRAGLTAEFQADIADMSAGLNRSFAHQQLGLATATEVTNDLIGRQHLKGALDQNEGERKAALMADEELPETKRKKSQDAHNEFYNRRAVLLKQEDEDRDKMRGAALRDRADVYGLDAEGRERSARALNIEREAQRAVEASRLRGDPDSDRQDILRGAINEEKAYMRELRRQQNAGFGQEVAGGTVAPGISDRNDTQLEPVIRGIESVKQSIDNLTSQLTGSN